MGNSALNFFFYTCSYIHCLFYYLFLFYLTDIAILPAIQGSSNVILEEDREIIEAKVIIDDLNLEHPKKSTYILDRGKLFNITCWNSLLFYFLFHSLQ